MPTLQSEQALPAVQGLLTRPDWQEACKVPLAMIPTGSGNALCANTGDAG